MDLYIKKGRRYKLLDESTARWLYDNPGHPQDGVWLVSENGTSCCWIGEAPQKPRIAAELWRDVINKVLVDSLVRERSFSVNDITSRILDQVSEKG